jgi:predicted dehydrogenase
MRKVRWGILSTARINRRIIPELHASERSELVAVASRDLQQAKDYAALWSIPEVYGNYAALLENKSIDIVYVSLPNDLHTEWSIRALYSGKHVLCEKPLCLSKEELDKIAFASKETGKSVMEAFMYVHHPQTSLFKKLIDEGEIGEVVSLYSEFASTYNRPAGNYRMSAEKGGGALWDIGVYPVSFFRYLISSSVLKVSTKANIFEGIDKSFWGRIDFASGVSGQFFVSFESMYSTRTLIMGTTGRLDISHPYNAIDDCKAYLTKENEIIEINLPKAALYAGEVENMNDVVLGTGKQLFSLEESLKVLELILALREDAGL